MIGGIAASAQYSVEGGAVQQQPAFDVGIWDGEHSRRERNIPKRGGPNEFLRSVV